MVPEPHSVSAEATGVPVVDPASDPLFGERHGVLARGYGHRPDPDDPAKVQAMPIVLHIPKAEPPARSALLEAAATATVETTPGIGAPRWAALPVSALRRMANSRRAAASNWSLATTMRAIVGLFAVLGLIVLIRTFLSFSLEVEIDGRWPWQRAAPIRSGR